MEVWKLLIVLAAAFIFFLCLGFILIDLGVRRSMQKPAATVTLFAKMDAKEKRLKYSYKHFWMSDALQLETFAERTPFVMASILIQNLL